MITEVSVSNKQKTLKSKFVFQGIGLHSGKISIVEVKPAKEDTGIIFKRIDVEKDNEIKALWTNVSSTNLSTTISNDTGISISTIEHLMSALSGMHIDNALIEINGPEIPIMDGSSEPFVNLIEDSGVIDQKKNRKFIRVLKEVSAQNENGFAKLKPNDKFSVEFEIDFPSKVVKKQSCHLQMINGNYKKVFSC